jgi:hypothetical protein
MAPKNIPGLNIGDTNQLLSAMGFQRPKTAAEIMQLYNQGLAGQGPLKDKFISPIGQLQTKPGETRGMGILKGLGNIGLAGLENLRKGTGFISAFTDPSGNIIGDILSQESPEGFRKRVEARDRSKDTIGGQEPFLPNVQLNVPGSDIFTDAGQEAMRGSAAKAIQDTLGKNIGDPSAFGAGDFADSETIKKVQEEIDKKNIDTSAPDSDIDYTETFTDKDLETATEVGVQGADTAAKKATVKALDEFLKDARPGVSPKTFDEYINEFGEATGLDISGEADTKQALMSFGLALMQNRAGKGFNISNILRATGEAGEAAMPDFRKAVAEAKAIRAKAGAYALSKKESDQKKAMDRKSYVVMPKEGGLANSILQNTGRFARLNSYELNNLMNNEEFNKQFEIIDSSVYTDMTKSLITAQGKNKTYIESPKSVPLYDGSDFKIDVFYANPNTGGDAKNKLATDPKIAFAELERMEKGLQRGEEKFGQIAQLLAQTDITIPNQLQSTVTQIARNFGIKAPDSTTTPIKQLQNLLKEIGARNAAAILGETGKTLSDNDRKLVDDIIGKIDFASGDKDELVRKLNRLYTQIQSAKRDQINQGYATLRSFGHEVKKNIVGM